MKPLDTLKLSLLLAAILVWFLGFRMQSQPFMLAGIVLVVVAFALRFVKAPPKPKG